MAKSVIIIPATKNRYTADPIGSQRKRKVAAYARVSTDHKEDIRFTFKDGTEIKV